MTVDELFVRVHRAFPTGDLTDFLETLNESIRTVARQRPWSWLETHYDWDLTANYTTGTVSITEGGTTVTGDGTTFTSAMEGRKFRAADATGTYEVDTYTDATHFELDRAWASDTITDSEYIIFEDAYDVPTDFALAFKLVNKTRRWLCDAELPAESLKWETYTGTSTRQPLYYTFWGADSTGLPRIRFWDGPVTADSMRLYYWKQPTAITDIGAALTEPPADFHDLLFHALLMEYLGRSGGDEQLRRLTIESRKYDTQLRWLKVRDADLVKYNMRFKRLF